MRVAIIAIACLATGCEQQPEAGETVVDEGNLIALALVELWTSDAHKFVVRRATRCSWLDAALSEDQGDDPFAPTPDPAEEPEARTQRLLS